MLIETLNFTLVPVDNGGYIYEGSVGSTCVHMHYVLMATPTDQWLKLDDDEVSMVTEDEVLKLSGGGIYRAWLCVCVSPPPLQVTGTLPTCCSTPHDDLRFCQQMLPWKQTEGAYIQCSNHKAFATTI